MGRQADRVVEHLLFGAEGRRFLFLIPSSALFEIDEESMEVLGSWNVGAYNMIGVAIDFEGYVWTVSNGGNAAYKFDPDTNLHTTIPIGQAPYTYSDMTGAQLANVIPVE